MNALGVVWRTPENGSPEIPIEKYIYLATNNQLKYNSLRLENGHFDVLLLLYLVKQTLLKVATHNPIY